MRQPYTDLYALFRHDPRTEEYFNALPAYVQDRLRSQYQAIDTLEHLKLYAQRIQARQTSAGTVNIGGSTYLPPPLHL